MSGDRKQESTAEALGFPRIFAKQNNTDAALTDVPTGGHREGLRTYSASVRAARKIRVRSIRAGDRVRIRATADSPWAGHEGVVVYAGKTVCDVRITVKPSRVVGRGRARRRRPSETVVETMQKRDLESLRRHIELIGYTLEMPAAVDIWPGLVLAVAGGIALLAGFHWWGGW
ncbi:hypothetical protein JI721_11575 [Alicyclobacillus cycloheptanicus]|uniref:Uncharacterized protein n=1 Tax=Alicyclobacillus cycloheptanicus TaxID=1457 RepID=A0ABT9XFV8_9BACL|nr:hypothetical protein [Alicyclobacillus cycloheptanicus]MDQ0189178.1 hypothetical protein [Alicyclobacillus cycloheptanicus]WDM00365.1 hypothetical protein JI721_11575 [Alicyclobacillus cycloheptanicus]